MPVRGCERWLSDLASGHREDSSEYALLELFEHLGDGRRPMSHSHIYKAGGENNSLEDQYILIAVLKPLLRRSPVFQPAVGSMKSTHI